MKEKPDLLRKQHEQTRALNARLQTEGVRLYLSDLVLAETHRLILHKIGIEAGRRFLGQVASQVERGFAVFVPVSWETLTKAGLLLDKSAGQDLSIPIPTPIPTPSSPRSLRLCGVTPVVLVTEL